MATANTGEAFRGGFRDEGRSGEVLPLVHGVIIWDVSGDPVEYEFRADSITLGRGKHNQIRLRCEHLSVEHLEFVRCAGGYEMRDLGSRNGTTVNGKACRQHLLRDGDRLVIGGRVAAHYLIVPEVPGVARTSLRGQQLEVAMVQYLDLARRLDSLEGKLLERIGGDGKERGALRLENLLCRVERLERVLEGGPSREVLETGGEGLRS